MSAMTGMLRVLRDGSGSASASSWLGTATRTIWQPEAVSSAICCSVALTSAVGVVVIDWTETGAATDRHVADHDLATDPSLRQRPGRQLGHSQSDAHAAPNRCALDRDLTANDLRRQLHRIEDVRREQQNRQSDENR